MSFEETRRDSMRIPSAALLAFALAASASAAPAAAPGGTLGRATVNGQVLSVSHAYLFHAPDNWDEKKRNAVVVITPAPLDAKRIDAAKTLSDITSTAGQRIVLEIRPDRKVDVSICHDGFGKGMCYSTSVFETDWKPGALEEKHVSGSGITTWMGKEETVFEKYKLFYEVAFDAAWAKDFTARR
jgi:hypothetical protein